MSMSCLVAVTHYFQVNCCIQKCDHQLVSGGSKNLLKKQKLLNWKISMLDSKAHIFNPQI